ncbi:hypothetical protein XBKB1_1120012 [Xenorhabdus bovienii str. kraussei Becker Underwood]|uniref:Uncharacterized protein n=1 Tax=Xenorhabdus bovienii str. kraussei Becker Underwood TaxID=1398204 RepID=A0A077PP71_XENBV|nr:hypothetical protein XBKB1_1120012 [Xenorhabdus bovienii str. kraussei Becker Underwood]
MFYRVILLCNFVIENNYNAIFFFVEVSVSYFIDVCLFYIIFLLKINQIMLKTPFY